MDCWDAEYDEEVEPSEPFPDLEYELLLGFLVYQARSTLSVHFVGEYFSYYFKQAYSCTTVNYDSLTKLWR